MTTTDWIVAAGLTITLGAAVFHIAFQLIPEVFRYLNSND